VLYIDTAVLDERLTGAAVARPSLPDDLLRVRVAQLHASLGEPLAAESRLAFVGERLRAHLGGAEPAPPPDRLAADLRDLLDVHLVEGLTLRAAADVLHAHPAHLVRRFTAAFGLPPHRYLTGRRIEAARGRLLAGETISEVAVAVGFHDQAHLHRHFAKLVGTTPARFARQGARWRDDLPR
jgi:AraC-like DNA-binding protein